MIYLIALNLLNMRRIAFLIVVLYPLTTTAQEFQGKASYQFFNNFSDVDWGKKEMSDVDIKMWKSKLTEESQTTFELLFTLKESSWAEVTSLESAGKSGTSKEWGEPLNQLLYKNIASQEFARETELFDKTFLVQDKLELPDWQITTESKTIGDYQALKAIWTVEESVQKFGSDDKTEKQRTIIAWYTPQIPIPQGPDRYWGLPGLILELKDGPITFICDQVIINASEAIKIKKPKNGQKVTAAEFERITEEKKEEILKKYNKSGKKG